MVTYRFTVWYRIYMEAKRIYIYQNLNGTWFIAIHTPLSCKACFGPMPVMEAISMTTEATWGKDTDRIWNDLHRMAGLELAS